VERGLRGGIDIHEAVVLGLVGEVVRGEVVLHDERRLAAWAEQGTRGGTAGIEAGSLPFVMRRERGEQIYDVVRVVVLASGSWRGGDVDDDAGAI